MRDKKVREAFNNALDEKIKQYQEKMEAVPWWGWVFIAPLYIIMECTIHALKFVRYWLALKNGDPTAPFIFWEW